MRGRKEQAGGEMDFGNVFLNLVAFNRSVQGWVGTCLNDLKVS